MLKLLFKKQAIETFAFLVIDGKQGKRRSPWLILVLTLLLLYGIGASVFLLGYAAWTLCEAFAQSGLTDVYFAMNATMACAIGLIGSMFMAKAKLFEAKDNDLLLSMPLPTWTILFARMMGLYGMTFFFSAIAFIPACVVYFIQMGFALVPAIFCLITAFVLPLLSLAISALIGWVLAVIGNRVRSKNLVTTILLLAFFTGYTLLYSKMGEAIEFIITHGSEIGAVMQTWLFPFWVAGLACQGNGLALLGAIGFFGGVMALVYLLLSRTFTKTITTRRGGAGTKYKRKDTKRTPAIFALMKKDLLRMKNPMILFNTALGSMLFIILLIFAFFNGELINTINASGVDKGEVAVIAAVLLSFIAASNTSTASTVSLEGENLWIMRLAPVTTREIFAAKLMMPIVLTCVPATIAVIAVCALLEIPLVLSLLVWVCVMVMGCLCSALGLIVNLKLPNLAWTSEMVAVKQSISVVVSMFANWGFAALIIAGHFTIGTLMSVGWYLALVVMLYAATFVGMLVWLGLRGTKAFERL